MQVYINDFAIHRVDYMISVLELATPGSRSWTPSSLPGRTYDYHVVRSTFPEWSKFFFLKKPSNWHTMTIQEQQQFTRDEYIPFAGNKKELIHILNKSVTNKKLTPRQQIVIEIIFSNLYDYEQEFYHLYGEELIDNEIPF